MFKESDFYIIQDLESVLLKAANGENIAPEETLMTYFEKDIEKDRFVNQLSNACRYD